METLVETREKPKDLSEYSSEEFLSLIYSTDPNEENLDLDTELTTLITKKQHESTALEVLISENTKTTNPRVQRQLNDYRRTLENIQTSIKNYEVYKELNSYNVEYTNRLIRLFFPRNINPQSISHSDVAQVQFLINSRPRANLNFKAPINFLHLISKSPKLSSKPSKL